VNSNSAAGTGSPATVDPATMWSPEVHDSINQESDEQLISEQYDISADGGVSYSIHFVADYKISGRLDSFPFDAPYFIVTRRSTHLTSEDIKLTLTEAGFSVPAQVEGWTVTDTGGIVCNVLASGGADDAELCAPSEETSHNCQEMVVMFFQLTRNSAYYIQNQLAPIVLVTILSAAAYFNDLCAYEARATIMATSLLSMMALQAYVSDSLPKTSTVTYIHYALYTSYALMGFGIACIVLVSHGLARDIDAAKLLNAEEAGMCEELLASSAPLGKRKARVRERLLSLPGGTPTGVKHWMLRLYYEEAAMFRRILDGGLVDTGDCALIFFPEAAHYVSKHLHDSAAGCAASELPTAVMPNKLMRQLSALSGKSPRCPTNIWLRYASLSLASPIVLRALACCATSLQVSDCAPVSASQPRRRGVRPVHARGPPGHLWAGAESAMRTALRMRACAMHNSTRISCLPPQVLAGRYFAIIRLPKETVACDNLLDFFATAG
jgi:hypothetical protein